MAIEAFAPAKINLTLHVTARRADGYHLLDSLVAFADIGDRVTVAPADDVTLHITGPFASDLTAGPDNLVLRAAALFASGKGARITLDKHLPVASGIGGGSADAAATLVALAQLWDRPVPRNAVSLGADVPACLDGRALRLTGVGERLEPLSHPLPAASLVLVNPGVAVPTPAVFQALERRDHPPMPQALPKLRDVAELAAFWE